MRIVRLGLFVASLLSATCARRSAGENSGGPAQEPAPPALGSAIVTSQAPQAKETVDPVQLNQLENYIEVRGLGSPAQGVDPKSAQGYQTALRAAQLVAYRVVAEGLGGFWIESSSLAQFNSLLFDEIRTKLPATQIQGGRVIRETTLNQYLAMDKPQAEIVMRFPILGSSGLLNPYMDRIVDEVKKTPEILTPYKPPTAAATPPTPPAPSAPPAPPAPAAVPEYDGLIVRVPAQFKPALGNKLVTMRGEVLYSAREVPNDILKNRGAAQFTNDEGKARALLADSMGSRNILSVDASLRTDTDAQLRDEDASKVHQANKKTAFLSGARVVFVIKNAS